MKVPVEHAFLPAPDILHFLSLLQDTSQGSVNFPKTVLPTGLPDQNGEGGDHLYGDRIIWSLCHLILIFFMESASKGAN